MIFVPAGTTTIWCSPTYNAEHYSQFNSRIYRAGQQRRTETIRIAYRDTAEIIFRHEDKPLGDDDVPDGGKEARS